VRVQLKQIIPKSIRSKIKQSAYWKMYNTRIHAKKLARSSKRLDLCSAQIAHLFHLAKTPSINGMVCVEVGVGWVLSHALVLHLLGAKKVIATDISSLAQPLVLSDAIHGAVPYIVRDILSPFSEHSEIRCRLNNLLSIKRFSFDVLRKIGIEYIAPKDLAKAPLGIPFDLVYSLSVLEHVPINDVHPLLNNLAENLRTGGVMIHAIHLEDHKSILDDPFVFLSEPEDMFSIDVQTQRGNRIRRSQWHDIFNNVRNIDFRFIYEWSRFDKQLPKTIDCSVSHKGEDDLRISHIGIFGIKK